MSATVEPIARMAAQLARLPGIGQKSAQRLAYHIAGMPHIWFILKVIFWFTELILELVPAVPDPIEIICGIVIAIFTLISEIIHLNLLCDRFGKGIGFKIGMFILPEVFMPIIAFGSSVYTPPEH